MFSLKFQNLVKLGREILGNSDSSATDKKYDRYRFIDELLISELVLAKIDDFELQNIVLVVQEGVGYIRRTRCII